MKNLIILPLIMSVTSCIPLAIGAGTVGVYKFSQAANTATGGKKGETLTEDSYQRCAKGIKKACVEKNIYTAMFFPVDTVYTTLTGRPDLIGSSHGKIWHEIDKKIPNLQK